MSQKKYEIDMCNGPLLPKIVKFAIPLLFSSILQLLFNAVDMIIAGQYAGSDALAAVGATSSVSQLIINLFIGLAVGSNVVVAKFYGARQEHEVSEAVHTSILLSLIGGIILAVLGVFLARPLLQFMDTPEDILDQAVLYMQIYFIGVPALLLYNFGSSILRAIGDTKRPMYYLLAAGILNVILNLILVINFHLGVAGVAIATAVTQTLSAILVLRCLTKESGVCRLDLKQLHINKEISLSIVRIGVPAGLQGIIFSFSNVLIQSSINSFGSLAMAGNTACSNIEGFIFTVINTFHQTALNFSSQNLGARNYDRIKKSVQISLVLVIVVTGVLSAVGLQFGSQLLSIYNNDPTVISYGLLRMKIVFLSYFVCGSMHVINGGLRGLGYSISPLIITIIGVCGFRIVWLYTIFAQNHDFTTLFIAYPVSWTATAVSLGIIYIIIFQRLVQKDTLQSAATQHSIG